MTACIWFLQSFRMHSEGREQSEWMTGVGRLNGSAFAAETLKASRRSTCIQALSLVHLAVIAYTCSIT